MTDFAAIMENAGDPRKGGKPKGTELLAARDKVQDELMKDTCWCLYLYYAGCGCIPNPCSNGVVLCIGEVCCCAGTCKSASCCDGDGCVAATIKCCCSLFHGEIPPSNTPGCGCGPLMCGGNLDPSRRDELSPREQEEFDMLSTTCWCLFLYCVGFGCNSPGGDDPCCMVEGKLCCIWSQVETDTCCDDGWIESTSKCCCLVLDGSYPAGRTPGCVVCGATVCGRQGLDAAGEE